MRLMRNIIREFNVYRWAGRMLLDAAAMRQRKRFSDQTGDASAWLAMVSQTPTSSRTPRPARFVRPPPPALARDCALFLDIDGTLAELAQSARRRAHRRRARRASAAAPRARAGRRARAGHRPRDHERRPALSRHRSCRWRASTAASGATPPGAIHLHAPRKETYAKLCKLLQGLAKRHPAAPARGQGRGARAALSRHAAARLARASHAAPVACASARATALQPGKMLLEVQPEGRDKGAAIDDFMARDAVRGPPARVRRRRSHRRARLRHGRAPGRLDDQGRRPAARWRATAFRTSAPCRAG